MNKWTDDAPFTQHCPNQAGKRSTLVRLLRESFENLALSLLRKHCGRTNPYVNITNRIKAIGGSHNHQVCTSVHLVERKEKRYETERHVEASWGNQSRLEKLPSLLSRNTGYVKGKSRDNINHQAGDFPIFSSLLSRCEILFVLSSSNLSQEAVFPSSTGDMTQQVDKWEPGISTSKSFSKTRLERSEVGL